MRIRRLEICGFKSFMERTTFVFDDGVTAIVGPNGCGKSNVVDAIRWVMGEQSAKHLRGRSMEDVIFSGSERFSPLGMAEVSLTFLNDRGDVPAKYADLSEITVTRRLFRSGESEYLLNRSVCRLLDIVELFLGTGVGTKAYSIIEQGRIGLIVSAKPEDRRSLIEEAAGVTKYKARRKAAERKLEATEQNLLRVGDILGELGKRLEALDRQAKKAEKYKKLKGEMREIELQLAALRWLELTVRSRSLAERRAEGEAEAEQLAAQVEQGEGSLAGDRAALQADAKRLEEKAARVAQLEKGAALNQTNRDFYGREREQLRARESELLAEIGRLDERLGALSAEIDEAEALQSGAAAGGGVEQAPLQEAQSAIAAARSEERAAQERLDVERQAAMAVLSEAAARKGELLNVDRRRGDLVDRLAKLRVEEEELQAEQERLSADREGLASRAGEKRQLRLELEARKSDAEEAAERIRHELAEADHELVALREEHADKRSRLGSLQEIQRSFDGYDRGVRAVMTRGGEEGALPDGVLGLVSDLLQTAPEHERAIEAVLGERLQAMVVRDHAQAEEFCRYLQEAHEGRATFLPALARVEEPLPPVDHPAVIGRGHELASAPSLQAPIVQALLGNVLVVQDLEGALSLWRDGVPHVLVTLNGEIVRPAGDVTGGDADGPGAGLLHRHREVMELEELVRSLETRVGLAAERHRRLARQAEDLETQLRAIRQSGHEEDLGLVHAEKDLTRLTEELARARASVQAAQTEREEAESQLHLLDVEAERVRGAAAQADHERARREERITELSAELSAWRQQAAALETRATELMVRAAADAERREGLEKRLARAKGERAESQEQQERAKRALAEAEGRLAELQDALVQADGNVTSLADELTVEAEQLREERLTHAAQAAELSGREESLRAIRLAAREKESSRGKLELEERELVLERQHLVSQMRERHDVELAYHVTDWHHLPPPEEGAEEKVRSLREQIERMGEVNVTAAEEYAELEGRHGFLTAQKTDLEESVAKLRHAIARIDKTSRERFEQTFHIVNDKFQQVFPRLFHGGKATLVLTPPETPSGEPGVEILAQPPGKKLQSVGLMSGGEKALTAVSLIFAIFLIKPTPFCLLDEVDAPLDEANVGRYNDMVREMSSQSQFILITHNKRTMEIGDTLYGVTMEEPGVSKTVSVKLSRRGSGPAGGEVAAAG